MKKMMLLLAVLFMIPKAVNAELFYAGNQVKEVPIYLDKITKQSYRYFKTAYRRSDNSLVYCVEPNKLLSVTDNYYYIIKDQEKALGIDEEAWRRIELLSYFGYGYENHTSEKWAAITQYLIWQTVLPEGWFLTFTNGYGGEFNNIHEDHTKEIEQLINNFETKPSFKEETFKITKNNSLILNDLNNVLNNYILVNDYGLNVSIKNNELEIIGTKNGVYKLEFVRGTYNPTKLYLSENNQAVVATDGSPVNNFSINVIVESGDLKIKRKYDNYLDNESIVENAVYEIIDSEQNKKIVTTNKNGEIILNDLPIGEVTIKELSPSIGYEKDENEYKVNIKNNEETILEVNPRLIIKKVNIIKKYLIKEENLLPNETGSIFSVIKNNNLKLTNKTNEDGLITFLIPYGNYTILQNSTILNYELMKDYNIFIKDSNEETLTFINYKTTEETNSEKETEIKTENKPLEKEEVVIENKEKDNIDKFIVRENSEKEIIENPKTGDNLIEYLGILISSGLILMKILRKMQ